MKNDPDNRDDELEALGQEKHAGEPLDSLDGSAARGSAAADARFQIIVAALMVLIIAALAGLWLIERNRRIRAERELAEFSQRQLQAQAMLSQLAMGGLEPQTTPRINRADLPPELVTLEHMGRTMLKISADAGERLGFLPGDIVFVADRPTTQPATSRPALEKPKPAPPTNFP